MLPAGRALWFTGGVAVLADVDTGRQRLHFCGHDGDILALAVHPNGRLVATGQAGRLPALVVWGADPGGDARAGAEISRMHLDAGDAAVIGLSFGGSEGELLAAMASDTRHTVSIWLWALRRRLCQLPVHMGLPPQARSLRDTGPSTPVTHATATMGVSQVFGCIFAPDGAAWVTYGVRHLKMWLPPQARARVRVFVSRVSSIASYCAPAIGRAR